MLSPLPLCLTLCSDLRQIRALWRHYYENTAGIVFMVNSADRERIDDRNDALDSAKENLHRLLSEPLLCASAPGGDGTAPRIAPPLLVLANKQDVAGAMSVQEVTERLGLDALRPSRQVLVQGCSTLKPDIPEVRQGLDWMIETLLANNQR